jgi:hypothetical protein
MSAKSTIGKSITKNLPVYIQDAANGLNCNCVCYDCNERLEAVQGSRDWHFRHYTKSNCFSSGETALHELAKQILLQNNSIHTRKLQISYFEPKKEIVVGPFRSDVGAKYRDLDLYFEIIVTHELSIEKKLYYQTNKINCIRIDLTNKSLLTASEEIITRTVLLSKGNKSFIFWHEDPPAVEATAVKDQPSSSKSAQIIFGGLMLLLSYLFLKKPRNKRKKRKSTFI